MQVPVLRASQGVCLGMRGGRLGHSVLPRCCTRRADDCTSIVAFISPGIVKSATLEGGYGLAQPGSGKAVVLPLATFSHLFAWHAVFGYWRFVACGASRFPDLFMHFLSMHDNLWWCGDAQASRFATYPEQFYFDIAADDDRLADASFENKHRPLPVSGHTVDGWRSMARNRLLMTINIIQMEYLFQKRNAGWSNGSRRVNLAQSVIDIIPNDLEDQRRFLKQGDAQRVNGDE